MTTCFPCTNPSVPAENAPCQTAGSWTARAWILGRYLCARPLRSFGWGRGFGFEQSILLDLRRMGMVELTANGWFRITPDGRAAFPGNRCQYWRDGFVGFWIDRDAQRSRVCSRPIPQDDAACDVRPDSWRNTFTHTQRCD